MWRKRLMIIEIVIVSIAPLAYRTSIVQSARRDLQFADA
jgi:hypothetical protein